MWNKNERDGKIDQAKGRVKQAVGDLTSNEDLKAEGQVDEAGGKVEETVGKVKRETGAAIEKIGKAVNDRIEIQFASRPVPVANLLLFPEMAERQAFARGTGANMRPYSEGEALDGIRLRQGG